jgi:hypothetical protein
MCVFIVAVVFLTDVCPFFVFSNVHRCRGFALEQMSQLTEVSFKRMFHVNRVAFNVILNRIKPYFDNLNVTRVINSSGSHISVVTRLAVTLRWLAGGSYFYLCFAWGVAP